MNWNHIAEGFNDVFSLWVAVRLNALRLSGVYRPFCLFILLQLVGSLIAIIDRLSPDWHPDYRVTWIPFEVALWAVSLATVYSLLRAVLRTLPGIQKLSQKVLNVTFLAATVIALWSAKAEYGASKASAYVLPLERAVAVTVVLNRAVCSAALIILLATLCFVLWFPVQMPKNLAVFSIGFAVYFAVTACSWLAWSFWPNASLKLVDTVSTVVLTLCYAYWAIFISSEGEAVPVRIGHSWDVSEQQRLIVQLEAVNANLLRAARR